MMRVDWLDTIAQDVRYGLRVLRRTPWFTAVAVLSLAAGVGSAATVFSLVDAVLLRTLPVRAPDELREFAASIQSGIGAPAKHVRGADAATVQELRRAADFADLFGFQSVDDVTLGGGTAMLPPQTVRAEFVTDNYFSVLGVRAAAGRLLAADDAGTAPVAAVLSERLWKAAFADGASVTSATITINGVAAAVVGVASHFRGVVVDRPADIFVPLSAAQVIDPTTAAVNVRLLARLRPGVTPVVAAQKMTALYVHLGPSMARNGELRVQLLDAKHGVADTRAPLTRPLLLGLVLAGVLLLLSCANAGGLLLARFAARQGEFGLRAAIGASRARLARQLMIEALLVAAMAAGAAVFVANMTAPLLLRLIPAGSVPAAFELRFDWRLILFTAVTSGAAALATGCLSVFRVTRTEAATVLNANARTVVVGSRPMTRALIAAQLASSLLLVVGAASMARTLMNLRSMDSGFDATDAFAIRVDATGRTKEASALPGYFQRLHDRIASAPQIERATFAQFGLMTGAATTGTIDVPGFASRDDGDRWVRLFWVGPDFFRTVGMPVLMGRELERPDWASAERVAVVNEAFARFYFGLREEALGRTVNRNVRIVGVVADARYDTLRDEPVRAMFTPHTQAPTRAAMTFIVRAAGDRGGAVEAALAAIRAHDAQLRPTVMSVSDIMAATLMRENFVAVLAGVLSIVATFLSCAGLYAAVAYATSQRRGEFAVRMTLGASPRDIVALVLREPLRVALVGIVIGIPGAYAVMRAMSSLLYGIAPFDPMTVAGASVLLVAAAIAAALWPALRAGRMDPLAALRAQ